MNPSFLEQFDKHRASGRAALVCGNVSLTYVELHTRCLALASRLRSLGVGTASTAPEQYDIFNPKDACHSPWVVIITERTVDAVIGVIAALMAGGAYVLMENNAPEAYVRGVIDDTAAKVVIRNGELRGGDENIGFTYNFPKENEIACAVFTSGSTGMPKGAVLEHRVINEMLSWQKEHMKPDRLTATAAFAPLSFIAALWEIFFPLANGFTLHILNDVTRRDLFALESYIESNSISYVFLPPNIAEIFTQTYTGSALKYLRVAGGRLKACGNPVGYEIMYHLGMAENGGSVTFQSIEKAIEGDIPIGKAWNNTRVYVDADTGEMAVSGSSLFRGYLSRKEETAAKLVRNPYTNDVGYEMMYLSGDIVKTDESGELTHLGRNDWCVKIRDMKVNLVQVESALCECAGVSECCVTAQSGDGEDIIIGWFAGGGTAETLKAELSARLPEHMIPFAFVSLEKLPRSVNGKVDRSQLIYSRRESEAANIDDMSETEARLAEVFGRLLGCSPYSVGAEDSFLRLGGDSLKFMRLQAEIAREFSRSVPYRLLFENPTPRMLAGILRNIGGGAGRQIPPAEPMAAYPLSAPMRQMWLLWRTGQDCGKYTVEIKCRFTGELDKPRAIAAFEELTRHNAILRSRFVERGGEVFQIIEESVDVSLCEHARREFDLTAAPLFDITLSEDILSFTTHHIIADATGLRVLIEDFWTLCAGGKPQNGVQTHDVTMWSFENDSDLHEDYWKQALSGTPANPLPYDFARPSKLTSASREAVAFSENETALLREYAVLHNATLFQLFLVAYAMLLSKLADGTVVVGVPFSGREHPETARVIGMVVRTLPVRLDVSGVCIEGALNHTRERFMSAWEHQDVSALRLAEIVKTPRTAARNPFYDVMINYLPLPSPLPDACGLRPEILRGEHPGALFDLVLDLREEADGVTAVFTYADELWKPETIRGWAKAFKKLLLTNELALDCEHQAASQPNNTIASFDEDALQICELSRVWKDILQTQDVSPSDDFFTSGGTSLAAIRIESALFEKGWLLSASDIFQNPILHDMAEMMEPLSEIDWEEES